MDPQDIKAEMLFSQRGLSLVVVPWYWVVTLKVARYSKNDPDDSVAILHFARLQFDKYPLDQRVQLWSILQDIIRHESRF